MPLAIWRVIWLPFGIAAAAPQHQCGVHSPMLLRW